MQPLITVVVPIFKVEKFLDKCIESIVNQTYKNLEIILIDDGSPDNCPEICDKWSKIDKRIVVIHKINSGVSAARNTGIKNSNGKFITFVDADDYLERDIINKALYKIQSTNSQLCQWGYSIIKDNKKIKGPDIFYNKSDKEKLYASVISYRQNEFELGTYFRAVWGKLFYTDLIKDNNILFEDDLYIGEDAIFLLKYLSYINDLCVVNLAGYNYRELDSSAVHRYKSDLLSQNLLQLKRIEDFLSINKIENSNNICTSMASFVWGVFNNLVYNDMLCNRNKKNIDAKKWYYAICKWKKNKNVDIASMMKIIRLQYLVNKFHLGFYCNVMISNIYYKFKCRN